MSEERVIDGVMHRLEGKAFVPLTTEELTARLLEARRIIDEQRMRVVPFEIPPAPPGWPLWYMSPVTCEPRTGDPMPPPITITCDNGTRQ